MNKRSDAIVGWEIIEPIQIFISDRDLEIEGPAWKTSTSEQNLGDWTGYANDIFHEVTLALFNNRKNKAIEPLTLTLEQNQTFLYKLASLGRTVYDQFFQQASRGRRAEAQAGDYLAHKFSNTLKIPAPTIITSGSYFPWELLFQGSKPREDDVTVDHFWGYGMAVARILNESDTAYTYRASSLTPPLSLLFFPHRELFGSYQKEYPELKKSVLFANQHSGVGLINSLPEEGIRYWNAELSHLYDNADKIIEYISEQPPKILHFACHCRSNKATKISWLEFTHLLPQDFDTKPEKPLDGILRQEVMIDNFDEIYSLKENPLVFLNACTSAGGEEVVAQYFNFPKQLFMRGARAIIATSCAVPDFFAAEFARVFYSYFFWRNPTMDLENLPPSFALDPMPIGEALRQTRRYFLTKHRNPLGLAYGLYTPANYMLQLPKRLPLTIDSAMG